MKWDWQYYSRGRSNFQDPTVDLPEGSKLIDSAISKRGGDQRKHSFLKKKILHKRKNGFTMNTQKYHITWWMWCFWVLIVNPIDSSILQNIISYLKMFSMQCRKKNITVEDNKKGMNIANFINIYRNMYTYIKYDKNDSK